MVPLPPFTRADIGREHIMGLAILFDAADAGSATWVRTWRNAWPDADLVPIPGRHDKGRAILAVLMARRPGLVAVGRAGLARQIIDLPDFVGTAGLAGAVLIDPFESDVPPIEDEAGRRTRSTLLSFPAIVVPTIPSSDPRFGRLEVHARMWEAALDTDSVHPSQGPSRFARDFVKYLAGQAARPRVAPGRWLGFGQNLLVACK